MELVSPALLVAEILLDQVASVGGGIDQDILRLFLQPSLNHGFQILIFNLKLLKGQIVHVYDKAVISVFDLGNYIV